MDLPDPIGLEPRPLSRSGVEEVRRHPASFAEQNLVATIDDLRVRLAENERIRKRAGHIIESYRRGWTRYRTALQAIRSCCAQKGRQDKWSPDILLGECCRLACRALQHGNLDRRGKNREMCEWCDRPVADGYGHGDGVCFDSETGDPILRPGEE